MSVTGISTVKQPKIRPNRPAGAGRFTGLANQTGDIIPNPRDTGLPSLPMAYHRPLQAGPILHPRK